MTIRDYVRAQRTRILIAVALFAMAALWTAVVMIHPMPPHTVTMATGPAGGAYDAFGRRYREIFAREGIKLRLQPTAGTLENLALLRDPRSGVSVSFLQGGTTSEKDSPDLESLGTVFYEPLWFFCRSAFLGKGLEALRGQRISIGPKGSGTRTLTLELFARNGIDHRFAELLALTPQEAEAKLLNGEIDAALMISSWDSPVVQHLLADRKIGLLSFPRVDAGIALYPFLNKVILPAGVGDLAKNLPPTDVVLLAPKASLVVRADLHPAIKYLLLDAAVQIHSGPGIFQKSGQFPAADSIDLPLNDEARQFYRTGRPFLQRHLPFWIAVLIGRLFVVLIPVIGVIYPLFRFVPALYGWKVRRRIHKLYGELRLIEQGLNARDAGQDVGDPAARLEELEKKANLLRVPLSCLGLLYLLRDHIALVRGRLGNKNE
jgi:TRAP transporter TAXI family solute receptor